MTVSLLQQGYVCQTKRVRAVRSSAMIIVWATAATPNGVHHTTP
jgi:hypothetical protein